MQYWVEVGTTTKMVFKFDVLGEATDFLLTCVENGYRATMIPVKTEE